MATVTASDATASEASSGVIESERSGPDCRACPMRPRCITYGWRSPGGLWFENAVVLRPPPTCRGWIGHSADIFGHFGEPYDPPV